MVVPTRVWASSAVGRLALLVVFLLPVMALSPMAASRARAQEQIKVTMVTDTAGLGDQNFNDAVREGLARAEADFGIAVQVLESQEAADYVPNLQAGAEDSDLTVATGFLLVDAVTQVSAQFPDSQVVLIDGTPSEERENVLGVLFREHEAAFLTGLIAGALTQTGTVGFLGGQDIPPVERYEVGFVAGFNTASPDAEDPVITYTDTFGDPALGKEQSLALYDQGADIILAAAGQTGIGTFEAAKEREGTFVIAADQDQSQLGAEQQLCTATKSLDAAVYEAVRSVTEGGFEGGLLDVGLAEDGVGLQTRFDRVPEEVLASVDEFRQAIIDGELTIPATRDELESFEAPADIAPPPASEPQPFMPEGTPTAEGTPAA